MLGARHQDTLGSLNGLASFYQDRGRYEQAEPLYKEALQTRREVLGARHQDTLTSLNALAMLYQYWGHWEQAESLYQEVLQANRETLGPRSASTLSALNNLAGFYQFAGRFEASMGASEWPGTRGLIRTGLHSRSPRQATTAFA